MDNGIPRDSQVPEEGDAGRAANGPAGVSVSFVRLSRRREPALGVGLCGDRSYALTISKESWPSSYSSVLTLTAMPMARSAGSMSFERRAKSLSPSGNSTSPML